MLDQGPDGQHLTPVSSLAQLSARQIGGQEPPPAALSAEDLPAQVWDETADPFTKTIQVTIGRLCPKLHDPDIIETRRNHHGHAQSAPLPLRRGFG